MFEATLHAADPDHQRLQRLTFAAAIAVASLATAIAGVWTLERMHIDRIGGPSQQFEIAQLSLLPPPKPADPPPPPPKEFDDGSGGDPSPRTTAVGKPLESDLDDGSPSDTAEPSTHAIAGAHDRGIPSFAGGTGCPGGVCVGTNPGDGTGQPCFGLHCGTSKKADAAPTEVEFSALRCLACADPDRAALRKTAASMQRREGTVVVRFCVDVDGRVDGRSIKVKRSHGDAAVDRITTAAIERWRFSPMKVGNQPRRACSSTTFNIRFD